MRPKNGEKNTFSDPDDSSRRASTLFFVLRTRKKNNKQREKSSPRRHGPCWARKKEGDQVRSYRTWRVDEKVVQIPESFKAGFTNFLSGK